MRCRRRARRTAALLLAGRTPEHVAALELRGADGGAAHSTWLRRPSVYIGAWPALRVPRKAVVVLGPDDDDLAASEADLHQLYKIGPHRVEFGLADIRARTVRVDVVPVPLFVAVHIYDPGDHRLIHQQCTDRPAGLSDSRPGQPAVGVAAQRVGPESGYHVEYLGLFDHLAHRRSPQVGAVLGADHPHPYLADRQRHRYRHLGEGAVQTQVHMHDAAAFVVVKQVLAPGGGLLQDSPADRGGAVDEPALRTRHHHRGAAEPALMQPGQPV